ncbi:MAG: hypothetical protein KKB50_17555 [Planctomycetes bacterium]|nr:hypothetical protein [Planctomycetota bacterium]
MRRDVLTKLADTALVALSCTGEAWPRTLLSETVIPDTWMGLVEQRDGRRRVVPAGEDPRPGSDDRLLLVRTQAVTVPLHVAERRASCGNLVAGSIALAVRWQARDDDLAALRQALMNQDELTLDRLAAALAAAGGAAALGRFVGEHRAEELMRADQREALGEFIGAQLRQFLFDTGLVLERVLRVEFASATLAQEEALRRQTTERVRQIKAREVVEQAATAATRRRLSDMTALLDKLKLVADADGQICWRDLLPALTPAERGRLLENLWRITPDRLVAKAIVAVVGAECVWLDPGEPERIIRRCRPGAELGGLRSVSFARTQNRLLVGAATGVWVLDAATGDVVGRHAVPGAVEPRSGFNAAAVVGDKLVATHSQLGCWCWPLDGAGAGQALLQPENGVPATIRAVTALPDGRVVFAADDSVLIYDTAGQRLGEMDTAGDTIHCLTVVDDAVFLGTAKGMLLRDTLDGSGGVWEVLHRAADRIESIVARRWNDLVEIVIPAGEQGVCGVYGEEGVVAPLLRTDTRIRRVWACDDLLVALNRVRDRLIVMNANTPARCGHDVPIARMLHEWVEDVCMVTAEVGAPPDETA